MDRVSTDTFGLVTTGGHDVHWPDLPAKQQPTWGDPAELERALAVLSTSGNSENLIAALVEARARGLATVALVGYDGGRVASEGLADYVIVTRSQNIPRIQEAQASAYHVLRELIEAGP